MGWLSRWWRKPAPVAQPAQAPPPRPPDWCRSLDDLFAELEAGQRRDIGEPEASWARDYELSLLPANTRFPRQGDHYIAKHEQLIHYLTAWKAPYTGGGETLLYKGETIWLEDDPGERPLAVYALPLDYSALEQRMVPQQERQARRYAGFYFCIKTLDLARHFSLVSG